MQQVFSSPLTYYSCCLLSLYQTQLFSLLPKQIESLITFHQPAQATTPDQYPPNYICHSPQWNTLPTHKTNHPGSTYTLVLPLLTPRPTVPSALPATDSQLTTQLHFGDEDDLRCHIRVCACLIILWDCPPEKTEAWVAARMLFVCLQSITNHDFWTSGAKEVVVWCYNRATTKYLMLQHRQTADRQLWCLCTVFTFVP